MKQIKIYSLPDEIRNRWINDLFDETIDSDSHGKQNIILTYWRRNTWIPLCCKQDAIDDPLDCSHCEWINVYSSRYYDNSISIFKSNKQLPMDLTDSCPLWDINAFILEKPKNLKYSDDAQKGLRLLLDLFSVWLWFLDEASGTIYFPEGVFPAGNNPLAMDFIRSMELPIGKGSSGYALRLNQGICISDTFADPRGGVSIEDIIARNYSYIAVPIREKASDNKSKIIAYIALSYPVPYAWHPKKSQCASIQCHCNDKSNCFYDKFAHFINKAKFENRFNGKSQDDAFTGYQPMESRIRDLYRLILNKKLSKKIEEVSKIGATKLTTDKKGDWKNFLQALSVLHQDADESSADKHNKRNIGEDAFGINYASLWEVGSSSHRDLVQLADFVNEKTKRLHRQNLIDRDIRYFCLQDGFSTAKNVIKLSEHVYCAITFIKDTPENEGMIEGLKKYMSDNADIIKKAIEGRFALINNLTAAGMSIYRAAYSLVCDETVFSEEQLPDEKIVRKKLFEGFARDVFNRWADEDSSSHGNLDRALVYWGTIEALSREVMDQLKCSLTYVDIQLFQNIRKVMGRNEFSIGIFVGMQHLYKLEMVERGTTTINEKNETILKTYQLAYDKYYEPWKYVAATKTINTGSKGENEEKVFVVSIELPLKAFVERNFKSYDTYKIIDYIINYSQINGTFGITDDVNYDKQQTSHDCMHISSSKKWDSILSQYFDLKWFEDSSKENAIGVLHIKSEKDGLEIIKLSKYVENCTSIDLSEIEDYLHREVKCSAPCLIFHLKKQIPFVYIPIDQTIDKASGSDDVASVTESEFAQLLKSIDGLKILGKRTKDESRKPLMKWDVYKDNGKWSPLDKSPINKNALIDRKIDSLHERGSHALFVYLLGDKSHPIGVLVIGRSLLHAENEEYVSFTREQQDVIDIFKHLATGRLNLLRQEESKIAALSKMAISQAHEMRNMLGPLNAFSSMVLETGTSEKIVEGQSKVIRAVKNIIYINNAAESLNSGMPEVDALKVPDVGIYFESIWQEILDDDNSWIPEFHAYIEDSLNMDFKFQISGNMHGGMIPTGSWKIIIKELIKNILKYCDCWYLDEYRMPNHKPTPIFAQLHMDRETFSILFRNGMHPLIEEANFAEVRANEMYQFTPSKFKKELFSTKIGQSNIQKALFANYGINCEPKIVNNSFQWNIRVPYFPKL